ncbi:hypothetical protein [Chitinophaga sp. 212800010-3]|uniref:hypothetical protein n=1 Tax=unclassified Chitinophaga TaxID=2619133 RepID=UPI002DF0D9AE|nr:hypothetical protein [Chitinophaga sp. 212800010-3]
MKKLLYSIYLVLILMFLPFAIQAQNQASPGASDSLLNILKRKAGMPLELAEKKLSAVFAMKLVLSSSGKVSKIETSKFFPDKLIPRLAVPDLYNGIHWEQIFKRKIKNGDILIIPFVAYDPLEKNATFYEYTVEDIFKFSDDKNLFINCLMMQPFPIKYGSAQK